MRSHSTRYAIRARVAGALVLCAAGAAACGSSRRDEPVQAEFKPATAQIAKGEQLYKLHCNHCHPGGASGLGPELNNKPLPGFAMRFQIRHGLGAMPAFSADSISDDDRDAIVEYLKALRKSD